MLQSSRKIHNTVFIQTAMAPSTDTSQWHPAWHHVQTVKVCQNHPHLLHPAIAPSSDTLLACSNGTQQWHPTTWHPAMAPYHGTASSNGTQHPAMAPPMASSNGTLPQHPVCQSVITACIQQWHPAMAPYHMAPSNGTGHGTQQWHHAQSVKVCHGHSPPLASSNWQQQWHPAPSILPHGTHHGTQQWAACSNGTEQ